LSAIWPFLGILFFFPAYCLLKYIFTLSKWLAAPAWASININNFNWYLGAGYYLLLFLIVWRRQRKKG
jgi:hypothetical protein